MNNSPLVRTTHWYQTVWGVGLIGLGVLMGAVVVLFIILTVKSVIDIRSGKIQGGEQEFYGSFSPVQGGGSARNARVDQAKLEQGDFPFLGTARASTTIVEFVDLKCPNCQLAYPILKQVLQKYGSRIRLIIRQFPLESLHPGTTDATLFALCAREQGKFWVVYDYFFTHQQELPTAWTVDDTRVLSQRLDMDSTRMETCMKNPATLQALNRDYADALAAGVRGTPTFFIQGRKKEGVIPLNVWEEILK